MTNAEDIDIDVDIDYAEENEETVEVTKVPRSKTLNDLAVENVKEIYRRELMWEHTLLEILSHICSQEHDNGDENLIPDVVAQIISYDTWVKELNNTRARIEAYRLCISIEDPTILPYTSLTPITTTNIFEEEVEEFVDGCTDDCYEITHQFACGNPTRTIHLTKSVTKTEIVSTQEVEVIVTQDDLENPEDKGITKNKVGLIKAAKLLEEWNVPDPVTEEIKNWTQDLLNSPLNGTVTECKLKHTTVSKTQIIIREIDEEEEAVQAAGPEYYSKLSHRPKAEYSLKATESDYESRLWRKELYHDEGSFPSNGPWKPIGKNLYSIMDIVWRSINTNGRSLLSNRASLVSETDVLDIMGPKIHPITGYKIKPHPCYNIAREGLARLRNLGYIQFTDPWGRNIEVDTEDSFIIDMDYLGDVYIRCLKTGPSSMRDMESPIDEYSMRMLGAINYDIDTHNFKDSIETKKYVRKGEWQVRVGILTNSSNAKMPLFVDEDWSPESEFEKYSTIKDGYKKNYTRLVQGGVNFNGSSQLHPHYGREYHPRGQFSMRNDWSEIVKVAFLARLASGNLNSDWIIRDKEGINHTFTSFEKAMVYYADHIKDDDELTSPERITRGDTCITAIPTGNDTYVYKRQVWMVVRLPNDAYQSNYAAGTRRVVLFADMRPHYTKENREIEVEGSWLKSIEKA